MNGASRITVLGIGAALSLGLTACGSKGSSDADAGNAQAPSSAPTASDQANGPVLTLADGPDVCFRAVAKHLGADAKVSEITSFFSPGNKIDSGSSQPAGQLTQCSVDYQDPKDPRKMVNSRMDLKTGAFSAPNPVEISVTGGNAAEFRLDDYLIPLSKIDAAALKSVMDEQKSRLGGVFSSYAWSGVRLSAPGSFSNIHTLRLDLTGRLASNDIKHDGYASLSVDGKKIVGDYLMP